MHKELEDWLDWTWDNREDIIEMAEDSTGRKKGGTHRHVEKVGKHFKAKNRGVNAVYGYYTGSTRKKPNFDLIPSFLDKLERLHKTVPAQLDFQRHGWDQKTTISALRTQYPNEELGFGFYHFRKVVGANINFRIYMNISDFRRGLYFEDIVKLIWKVDGLTNAKVAAPNFTGRSDSVVIYCTTQRAQTDILEAVREFNGPRRHRYFNDALPKLVQPVAGMKGIGKATEPPSVHLMRKGGEYLGMPMAKSFGSYRAALIFMALERTKFEKDATHQTERKVAFKRRAVKYLTHGGIDVDRPALQDNPDTFTPVPNK